MRVRKELPRAKLMEDDDLLQAKSGGKINVLSGACMDVEMKDENKRNAGCYWESGRQMRRGSA